MVSTRQSSSVGNVDHPQTDTGGIRTRHSTYSHQPQGTEITAPQVSLVLESDPQISNFHLLLLPQEIFDKIFSYVGYKTVSQLRLVCRHLDRICSSVLNSIFQRLQTQMLLRFQAIKAKMPRRESARRNHPLACESDIIETLHMRLTLLQMTFGKHIERKHICFFPGEILDEVYRILHYIKVTPKLARPYRVTDELFDLSTMAMEYFKEHIEPSLPEIGYFGTEFLEFSNCISSSPPHNRAQTEYESPGSTDERPAEPSPQPQSNTVLRKRIRKIKQGMKRYNSQLTLLKRELKSCKAKLADQQKQFLEFATRMDEHDKKNEETSRKFSTLLQELNKCKTELQYWRSKSPMGSLCLSCGKSMVDLAMFPDDIGLIGQPIPNLDDPQPSTSSDDLIQLHQQLSPLSCTKEIASSVLPQSSTPKSDEEIKMRHSAATKRKSSFDDNSSSLSKKSKKTRSMIKSRCKRS